MMCEITVEKTDLKENIGVVMDRHKGVTYCLMTVLMPILMVAAVFAITFSVTFILGLLMGWI